MSFQVDAVYLDGVLKPAVPLAIPNCATVRLAVETASSVPEGTQGAAEPNGNDVIARLRTFRGMLSGLSREQMLADRRQGLSHGDSH